MAGRIYIGNLSDHAREKDVEKFFKGYGKIMDVILKNGYGFVEFDDPRDAEDAVCDLNNKSFMGERITIEHARVAGIPPRGRSRARYGGSGSRYGGGGGRFGGRSDGKYGPPVRTKYRLLVENLSSRVSWQDLKDMMRKAGDVIYADAHRDKRNEGVVDFSTRRDMEKAIKKYDGYDLYERKLKIREEKDQHRSRSSGSRSRSGSRRKSSRRHRSSSSRSRSSSYDRKRKARDDSDRESSKRRGRSKDRSKSRSRSAVRRNANSESLDRKKSVSGSADRNKGRSKSASRSRSNSPKDRSDKVRKSESGKRNATSEDREPSVSGTISEERDNETNGNGSASPNGQ